MTIEHFVTRAPRPVAAVPSSANPVVSFVFVAYGTGPVLVDAIGGLTATMPPTVSYEVVVVDNRHPDRPDRTVNQLLLDTTGVRVVRSTTNLGFAGGCNRGAASAAGELIGFVNPDVRFDRPWFEHLAEALDDGAAIAAPVLVEPDGTVQSAGHRLWSDGSTSPIVDVGASTDADYASAACWVMRRRVFDDVGGFDERFHPAYYEDVDLAWRCRSAGGTRVVAGARVVHLGGASTPHATQPDTSPQQALLMATHPDIAEQPPRPG